VYNRGRDRILGDIMKRISTLFLSLILLTAFSACGDLFTNKNSKQRSGQNFLSCSFDPDAFSFVLEQNIKSDILCLKDTLDVFIKIVQKIDLVLFREKD
jgi:hypothetical protein